MANPEIAALNSVLNELIAKKTAPKDIAHYLTQNFGDISVGSNRKKASRPRNTVIRLLHNAGLSSKEISEIIGGKHLGIYNYISAIELTPHYNKRKIEPLVTIPLTEFQKEKLKSLIENEQSPKIILQFFKDILKDTSTEGESLASTKRTAIHSLHELGLSVPDIDCIINSHSYNIYAYLRKCKLKPNKPTIKRQRKTTAIVSHVEVGSQHKVHTISEPRIPTFEETIALSKYFGQSAVLNSKRKPSAEMTLVVSGRIFKITPVQKIILSAIEAIGSCSWQDIEHCSKSRREFTRAVQDINLLMRTATGQILLASNFDQDVPVTTMQDFKIS